MSQTIDSKVVEMKFDNSNFETNVKQSMSTLEQLKKDLKLEASTDGFKQISEAAKDVSFDGLTKGISEVKTHFSGLEVMAVTALANITSKAVDAGLSMAKSLSIDPATDGFSQYEKKTQSVQTIMNATGKDIDSVNASLDKLIWFADETSYSFGDMVDNVGKFTSVGVDLETASKAMMGISNWAAVSGQNASTATRAMYNLSQAMGLGYVGLTDWQSIERANMATSEFKQQVIDTAVAMGKLNKGVVTTQNFRESLKDKWFDNEVLLGVLGKYGDYTELVYNRVKETGELCAVAMNNVSQQMGDSYDKIGEKALRAAQEAKTFHEAIDATGEAVKSQWAALFESAFGNYDEAKVTFTNLANSLWTVFAEPLSNFNDTVSEAMSAKTIDKASWSEMASDMRRELGITGTELTQFQEVIKDVARESGVDIESIIEKNYGNFESSLLSGWLNTDIFQKAVERVKEGVATTGEEALSSVQDVVNKIWNGDFGNGEDRKKNLEALGYDYDEIQKLVELGYGAEITMEDLGEKTKAFFATTGESASGLKEALEKADTVDSFKEIAQYMSGADLRNGIWNNLINSDTGALVTYVGAIRDAFSDIFGTIESGTIHDFLVDLYARTSALLNEDRVERFKTAVENLFHGIHAGIEIIKGVLSVIKAVYDNTLGPILSGAWNIIKAIASGIGQLFARADKGASSLTIFSDAVTAINETLAPVKKAITAITSGIADFITALFNGKGAFQAFKESVEGVIDNIFGHDGNGFAKKLSFREFIDKITNLKNAVSETFKTIGETFSKAWESFQNTELGKKISGFVERIKTALGDAFGSVQEWFKNLFKGDGDGLDFGFLESAENALTHFNERLKALTFDDAFTKISDAVLGFKTKIQTAFQSIKSFFENNATFQAIKGFVSEKFGELKSVITNGANDEEGGSDKTFLEKVIDGIKAGLQWFTSNLPSIIETLKGMLGAGALGSLIALILKIKNMFSGGAGILKNVNKVLSGLGSALKGFAFKQIATGISAIATSMAALLLVIGAIAYFCEPESLKAVGDAIFIIAAGLAMLSYGISAIIKAIGGNNAAKKENIGSGVGSLLKSVGTSLENLSTGAASFLKYTGLATLILSVAAALAVMTAAVVILSGIDTNDLIKGLGTVIVLLGAITAAMAVMSKATSSSSGFSLSKSGLSLNRSGTGGMSGFGFIGLAVSLLIFVQVIKQISDFNLAEIAKGVATIGVILLELSVFTRLSGQFSAGTGVGLMATGAAMLLFVKSIDGISEHNLEDLLKSVLTLGAIFTELIIFTNLAGSMKISDGVALVVMGAAILVFVNAIEKLSEIGFRADKSGLGGLVVILAGLAAYVWVINTISSGADKLGTILLGIAAIIGAVAAAIWVVSEAIEKGISFSDIGAKISELAVSLVEGLITAITGSADTIISGLISMLSSIAEYAPQLVDVLVTLVTNVLTALTERLPELAGVIADFCGALIESFAEAFKDVDVSSLVTAINELLFATASLVVIGKFGSFGAVTKGIGMLAEVIGAFGLIIAAFGALNLIPGFDDFMAGGVTILTTIADGIGSFFGTVIGSFAGSLAESMAASLPAIGTSLSDFMTNVQPFIQGCSGIDSSFPTSVANLVDAMVMIAGGTFVDSIADGFSKLIGGDGTEGFISKFSILADGIVSFADKIKGVDFTAVDGATSAAQIITALSLAAPESGGFLQDLTGETDLEKFAINIGHLGTGVASFIDAISGKTIDDSAVAAATAAASMVEVLTGIAPPTGGLLQEITGETDLASFATNIGHLGTGVASFLDSISGKTVDSGAVEAATSAASMVEVLTGIAPKSGGILQDITGETDLSSFATNIGQLGTGVASFLDSITGKTVDSSAVEAATSAASIVENLTSIAPSSGGWFQDLTGTIDLEKFATNISQLGTGVASFIDSITGKTIDDSAVKAAESTADIVTKLTSIAPTEGGFWQELTGETDLEKFAGNIVDLGTGVASFLESISSVTVDGTAVSSAESVAGIVTQLTSIAPSEGGFWQELTGETDLEKFAGNIADLGAGVANFIDSISGKSVNMEAAKAAYFTAYIVQQLSDVVPKTGGLWQSISGTTDLGKFGDNLGTLGSGIASFVDATKDVSETNIGNAKTVSEGMIAIMNLEWPATDKGLIGWIQNFATGGSTDFGTLKQQFEDMGSMISTFCESVDNDKIDSDSIDSAKTAAESIISLFNMEWPSTDNGGIIGFFSNLFTGSDAPNWDTLKTELPKMGEAIIAFTSSVSGISTMDAVNASIGTEAIKDILDAMPTGDTSVFSNLDTFSTSLTTLGTAFGTFSSNITAVDWESVTSADTSINTLITTLNSMADVDFDSATSFSTALGTLAESGIEEFTTAFTDSEQDTIDSVTTFVTNVATAMSVSDDFNTSGDDDAKGFNEGFGAWQTTITTLATTIVESSASNMDREWLFWTSAVSCMQGYVDGLNSQLDAITTTSSNIAGSAGDSMSRYWAFWASGTSCIQGFVDGMGAMLSSATSASDSISGSAGDSMNRYWAFWTAGTYCMTGFIDGMNAYAPYVYSAVSTIGTYAVMAANAAVGAASPAKEFVKTGMYSDMGFAKGLTDYAYMVEEASSSVGEGSLDAIKTALQGIDTALIDEAPTIRPVLDLSDIQNGAGLIDEMLSADGSYRIGSTNADRIAATLGDINADAINGMYDDTEVIAVINDLGTKVDNLNTAINNIKLYINGKQLVGGIITDINDGLRTVEMKAKKGV